MAVNGICKNAKKPRRLIHLLGFDFFNLCALQRILSDVISLVAFGKDFSTLEHKLEHVNSLLCI